MNFVGRNKEHDRIFELLEQVKEDQGQVCGVIGEAGIGKSRLIREIGRELLKRDVPFVKGQCSIQDGHSFEAFREIVTQLVEGKVETLTRWQMTDAETDFLRLFLEPNRPIERLLEMTDEQLRSGLFYSVRKLIHSIAQTPLVVILEDMHEADESLLELFEFILEGMEKTHLLIVISHRLSLSPTWRHNTNYTELHLHPLTQEEVVNMLKGQFNVDRVAAHASRIIFDQSVGNPLFVEELTRQLRYDFGLEIEEDDDGGQFLRLKDDTIQGLPKTLRSLIGSRLKKLEHEQIESLKWACILGRQFPLDDLRSFLQDKEFKADELIDTLSNEGYIFEERTYPRNIYRFTHNLLYDATRKSIDNDDWVARHGEVGAYLRKAYAHRLDDEVDRIAGHYIRSGDSKGAIEMSLKAGRLALDSHQYPRAVFLLREAARRWEKLVEREISAAEIYPPLIKALLAIGSTDRAREALAKWKKAGVEPNPHDQLLRTRLEMTYHMARSEFGDVVEVSERALHILDRSDYTEGEQLEVAHDRMLALLNTGRAEQALQEASMLLRRDSKDLISIPRLRIGSLLALCATVSGNPDLALEPEHLMRYIEGAQQVLGKNPSPKIRIEMSFRIAQIYDALGRFEEAIPVSTHILDLAQAGGYRHQHSKALVLRGRYLSALGRYGKALNDFERALAVSYEMKDRSIEIQALVGISQTLISIGAVNEASDLAIDTHSPAFRHIDPRHKAQMTIGRAALAELRKDVDQALTLLEEASGIFTNIGDVVREEEVDMERIRMEAVHQSRNNDQLKKEFKTIRERARQKSFSCWHDQRRATEFTLLMGDPAHCDPTKASTVDLMTKQYLSKVHYFEYSGRSEEAANTKRELERQRQILESNVPEKFLESFRRHPYITRVA